MKVILNQDVKYLGEEGDVKVVANGYARNYLYPRNLAVPYNEATVALLESRKVEIEAKKEAKRRDQYDDAIRTTAFVKRANTETGAWEFEAEVSISE